MCFYNVTCLQAEPPHAVRPLSFRQPCESNVTHETARWGSIPLVKCIIFLLFLRATTFQPLSHREKCSEWNFRSARHGTLNSRGEFK
jgi:hypothetical protein